jgi:hypothetical protein
MIAILEFNLPEDKCEFDLAIKAGDYYSCMFQISQLRRRWKHQEEEPTAEMVFEAIAEIIEDSGITL